MTKKINNEDGGYVIRESQIKNLEGKLLTHIEAMGLDPKQEYAAKSLVSQVVWDLLEPSYVWIDADVLEECLERQTPLKVELPPLGRRNVSSII